MNCTITLTINGEQKEMSVEGSPSTLIDESVVNALSQNPEILQGLLEDLRIKLNSQDTIKPVTLKNIVTEGILANCSLNYLRNSPEYSHLKFPDGNANILLVDNLKLNGKPISGRVVKNNDEEIYVVKNTPEDLQRFAYYLKEKNTIASGVAVSEDSSYYPELSEILNKRKKGRGANKSLTSIEDMLLEYIDNKKAFTNIFLENGKSAIQVIEKFMRNLKDYDTPNEYNDQFVTALNYNKFYKGNGQIFVSYNVLYNLFQQYYPAILDNLGITKESEFSNSLDKNQTINAIMSTVQNADPLQEQLSQAPNGHAALLQFALGIEPDFTFAYKSQSKKGITLEQQYTPISDKYGITFDTIKNMTETKYKGYNIYQDGNNYFISRGTLTESSLSNKYATIEGAKGSIDKLIGNQVISKNSLAEFKFRDSYTDKNGNKHFIESFSERILSKTNYNRGQIIESLNVPVDPDTQIRGDEMAIFGNVATLQDFYNIIDTYKCNSKDKTYIKQHINTPEKASLFIYKVNEQFGNAPRKDVKKLHNIVDAIENAEYNYYYVEDKHWTKNKNWSYKLIHLDKDSVTEAKKVQGKPVRLWLDAISTALNNQFGVPIHIINATEVEDMKVADPNVDKAFIYNGEVYVNSSIATTNDLLHEHVHLILGALKSNPDLRQNYEGLVNLVASTKEGQLESARISERYSALSEMDLREEVFANLFSNYIRNQISIETEKVFTASEDELAQLTKSVFNTDIYDIKAFYGKSLISIFSKFNKEVSKYMQEEGIDFGSTKNIRKISNWISDQIRQNNIKEEC